jgi:hypothetical protein
LPDSLLPAPLSCALSGDEILCDVASAFPTKGTAAEAIECNHVGHAYLAFGEAGIDLVLDTIRKRPRRRH